MGSMMKNVGLGSRFVRRGCVGRLCRLDGYSGNVSVTFLCISI